MGKNALNFLRDMKGVVFDLDGVLLDAESNLEWLYRALKETLGEHGIEISEKNLMKIHPKNVHKFEKMSDELGVRAEDLWETRNRNYTKEKMKAMKNGEIGPFPDVNSLYKLRGKYGLSILSDSPQEVVDFFIKEFGYEDLFDCGVGRGAKLEDLEKLKPNPYPLNKLKEKIGEGNLIYVGDSEKDREFAKNAGIEFIFLSRNKGFRKNKESDSLDKVVEYLLTSNR